MSSFLAFEQLYEDEYDYQTATALHVASFIREHAEPMDCDEPGDAEFDTNQFFADQMPEYIDDPVPFYFNCQVVLDLPTDRRHVIRLVDYDDE
jgi:hypothetical protein